MASSRSSAVENELVKVRRCLSAEEQRDINSLFVKTGTIGGLFRLVTSQACWT